MYVDLNPIRAKLAETPETSQFTGAFERILGRQAASAAMLDQSQSAKVAARDAWLSPVSEQAAGGMVDAAAPTARASNRGFLPLSLDDCLRLLDWTGRQLRADKRGAIPAELRPILDRLAINADTWLDTVSCFGQWFHRAVGRLSSMAARASRSGRFWFQGLRFSDLAFG